MFPLPADPLASSSLVAAGAGAGAGAGTGPGTGPALGGLAPELALTERVRQQLLASVAASDSELGALQRKLFAVMLQAERSQQV